MISWMDLVRRRCRAGRTAADRRPARSGLPLGLGALEARQLLATLPMPVGLTAPPSLPMRLSAPAPAPAAVILWPTTANPSLAHHALTDFGPPGSPASPTPALSLGDWQSPPPGAGPLGGSALGSGPLNSPAASATTTTSGNATASGNAATTTTTSGLARSLAIRSTDGSLGLGAPDPRDWGGARPALGPGGITPSTLNNPVAVVTSDLATPTDSAPGSPSTAMATATVTALATAAPSGLAFGPARPHDHPILAEAPVALGGTWTHELAVADPSAGTVRVFAEGRLIFSLDGLSHPGDLQLADLNGDGVPDLFVADSGRNRVLAYPGLASGGFGGELNAGAGFAVGEDPVDLTVSPIHQGSAPNLLVTNRGSNEVAILAGRGTASSWTLDRAGEIATGLAPVGTEVVTPPGQTDPVVAVCNSGSKSVALYQAGPNASLGDQEPRIVPLDDAPSAMYFGSFLHHNETDMVMLSADSRTLTILGNVFGEHPTRQTIATAAGVTSLSALAFTNNASGLTDLLLASSDGRLSILQAGPGGLQLTDLTTRTDLGVVTAIAGSETANGSSLDLFEAIDTGALIAEYRLDLGTLLLDAEGITTASPTPSVTDDLTWELLPTGSASLLDLVGVLGNGPATPTSPSLDPTTAQGGATNAQATTGGALSSSPGSAVSPADAESLSDANASARAETDAALAGTTPTPGDGWASYVLGLDAAFDSLTGEVRALSAADLDAGLPGDDQSRPGDRAPRRLLTRRATPTRDQATTGLAAPTPPVDHPASETRLRARAEGVNPQPSPTAEADAEAKNSPDLVTAAVGSAVAVRLLIHASPPRPPRTTRQRSPGAVAPWPELIPPTSPHA